MNCLNELSNLKLLEALPFFLDKSVNETPEFCHVFSGGTDRRMSELITDKKTVTSSNDSPTELLSDENPKLDGNNVEAVKTDQECTPQDDPKIQKVIVKQTTTYKLQGLMVKENNSGKPPLPPSTIIKRQTEIQRRQFVCSSNTDMTEGFWTRNAMGRTAAEVDMKLLKFRLGLRHSREEIARLPKPNLENMESLVRSSMVIDRLGRALPHTQVFTRTIATNTPLALLSNQQSSNSSELEKENREKEWYNLLQKANQNLACRNGPRTGTCFNQVGESDSGIGVENKPQSHGRRESTEENQHNKLKAENVKSPDTPGASVSVSKKSHSMLNLGNTSSSQQPSLSPCDMSSLRPLVSDDERARSMEFIVDDSDKNAHLRPPENTLKLRQENRQLSEHELRVQRSLNKLNVPDWYKKYGTGAGTDNNSLKQKNFGSGTGLAGGWSGLSSSKTSSLTSLQSAGRYSGRVPSSSRVRNTTSAGGGRTSRESLMSPSSTASASPSPYYERSSFTYGMPYALTRFATSRMSCGASPASLSPSPSPVGGVASSSTSTPTASGPNTRHSSFTKQPYLGWRSQERLNSKTLYRTPSERLAADLLAQKSKVSISITPSDKSSVGSLEMSPKKETASDLSLNNSEESNNRKLIRVRSSIKEVSNAIVDYVNESKPLDDGTNGRISPRRGLVWLESSFVGTKPIDSPDTPDTPSIVMPSSRGSIRSTNTMFSYGGDKSDTMSNNRMSIKNKQENHEQLVGKSSLQGETTSPINPNFTSSYLSRNEQMEERSNSTVSSPTLEDILDSLLALRRPNKKIRSRSKEGHLSSETTDVNVSLKQSSPTYEQSSIFTSSTDASNLPTTKTESPISDWHERMNQPLLDTAYFPDSTFLFSSNNDSAEPQRDQNNIVSTNVCGSDNMSGGESGLDTRSDKTFLDKDDDDAFGILKDIPNSANNASSGVISSAFTPFTESTPSTPARHRRVSFDLDISDKEEKSSRSKRDESVGGTIHCRHNKCGRSAVGLEARREFKTCHNCNAYYCSRECRRAHWEKHKKVCMQSRVGALCKQIINHVKDDSHVVSHLSNIAKTGSLAKGRGCVKLFFSSPDRAERFLTGGLPELPAEQYISSGDMLPEEMGPQIYTELIEQCRSYNLDNRFVLFVTVCVVNEVPTSGAVKWEREMISRSSKLRLLLPRFYDESQRHHQASTTAHLLSEEQPHPQAPYFDPDPAPPFPTDEFFPPPGDVETLILRSVPAISSFKMDGDDYRRLREVNFANILKQLSQRRVELRQTYPDIYSKLCNYVENDEPFFPVTIYPRNGLTGQQFMCLIMPDSTDIAIPTHSETRRVETVNISEPSSDE